MCHLMNVFWTLGNLVPYRCTPIIEYFHGLCNESAAFRSHRNRPATRLLDRPSSAASHKYSVIFRLPVSSDSDLAHSARHGMLCIRVFDLLSTYSRSRSLPHCELASVLSFESGRQQHLVSGQQTARASPSVSKPGSGAGFRERQSGYGGIRRIWRTGR